MNLIKEAKQIIHSLESHRFFAMCPCCNEPVLLKDTGLFYLDNFTDEAEQLYQERIKELKEREKQLKDQRKSISWSSETGARAVNIGFVFERIAPTLKDFPFNRNDCRSLFDPIDYIIFEGLREKGKVNNIFFVDIKTGSARLQSKQKEIRELVERKHIVWDIYKTEMKK